MSNNLKFKENDDNNEKLVFYSMGESHKELLVKCKSIIEGKIQSIKLELHKIQESANNETKSSMGDKYETGRAMAQNEIEKLSQNLQENLSQLEILNRILPSNEKNVRLGSIIQTNKETFFLSVSLGEIKLADQSFFAISSSSPIGKLFLGKVKGDKISFNGMEKEILNVIND